MNGKKILIFNWKMNGDLQYAEKIKTLIDKIDDKKTEIINKNFEIVLCPPIIFSNTFDNKNKLYSIGAQNCSFETSGSYTGEISAKMLKEIGIEYVILGHSERRKYFNENEDITLKKMDKAFENNITPIVCVYSFKEDKQHISNIISDFLNHKLSKNLIIAYEPEFSIGSGINDSLDSIENNVLNIKNISKNKNLNNKKIYVIYGGSVTSENFLSIIKISDGVLIGKASLDYNSFNNFLEKLL